MTIKIGISSCLLGNPVRYDGAHQQDSYLSDTMGHFFEFVPVCPEFECGLGAPRETMCLLGDFQNPRLMTTLSGIDHTAKLLAWAQPRIRELSAESLSGFIFKSKSPSCGRERVKVYPRQDGKPKRIGIGLFARALMEAFPLLPVADEAHLHDLGRRENFIERIFICRDWRAVKHGAMTVSGLASFHSQHQLQIMAHSPRHCRAMGRLLAQNKPANLLFDQYEALLLAALRLLPTVKKHGDVLRHIVGYFKKLLPAAEKNALMEGIDLYRQGEAPLLVPVTLLNHYARQYQQHSLAQQVYLHPHPLELQLRNHA